MYGVGLTTLRDLPSPTTSEQSTLWQLVSVRWHNGAVTHWILGNIELLAPAVNLKEIQYARFGKTAIKPVQCSDWYFFLYHVYSDTALIENASRTLEQ